MSLDGILGSGMGSFGRRDAAAGDAAASDCREAGRPWEAGGRGAESVLSLDSGGGYGEMDMLVTEAEWAW